jgi:hypothetical protein
MTKTRRMSKRGLALLTIGLIGCGGGSAPTTPAVPTPTPIPVVTITSSGEGNLVIHPSVDTRFSFALETPIRITETAGGTADWNFARISYLTPLSQPRDGTVRLGP